MHSAVDAGRDPCSARILAPMKIALGIEYHGGHFQGWQSQPNGQGVQDHVERAVGQIAGHAVRLHAAGRTDTGVHAWMQVAHMETTAQRPQQAWVRGCNAMLPPWVRIRWACVVDDDFHARFSAQSRCYEYVLLNQAVAPAIAHGRVGWYHRPLQIERMQAAAVMLLGEHDFSAFRASECQASSPVRTMLRAELVQLADQLHFRFQANAFLQHQIRNMVGALLYVGQGKLSLDAFAALLLAADRTLSPPTFMPDGLYFAGVDYDARWQLPDTLPAWARNGSASKIE